LKKEPKGRIIKKERDYDSVRERERKYFEEGRKVRMQMTFIYSTVKLNPWVRQLPKVKFSMQSAFCKRNAGRYHEANIMKRYISKQNIPTR
jgi:hypothetical protein